MSFYKFRKKKPSRYTENKVRFVRGGREYFQLLLELINSAKDSVHLQTYIYDEDETGNEVAAALIAAAQRGVSVYLMVDGYASQALSKPFIKKLQDASVHFRFFEPLFKSKHFYFGRRLHNKMLVVDTRFTLLGGVNITNRYNDMPGQPAWLDFAVLAEGPVSKEVCIVCWKNWKGFPHRMGPTPCENQEPQFEFQSGEVSLVRMRRNDWVRNILQISNSYLEMFKTASSHITILSSYALPGNVFRKNLERAVRRGVKVRIIISGQSDVILVKHAERYWYDWLMRNNIEIYEYTANVLHGKLAVCDGKWMTIGSYNVNDLSAYASIELNLDIRNPAFIRQVETALQDIIDNDCVLISKESLAGNRMLLLRLWQWTSYNLIRLAFTLFTFYYKKQK